MIHVVLSGSPYEMGYQHGRALRPLVDAVVRYESRNHANAPFASLSTGAVREQVRRLAPSLLEELQGIAAGSELPFDLLLEINLRVLYYCTVIAFPYSKQGPLLGKNLDFPVYAYQAIFSVQPDEGHAFTHIGCAGSVASYGGLNVAGLAMGHAAVPLKDAGIAGGLPVAFLRRLALQHCAITREATVLVNEYDAWRMGDNLLFLDKDGDAVVIEKRPGAQMVRRPVDGALWCSNCFASFEEAQGNEEGEGRYRYVGRMLHAARPGFTRKLLQNLLSSHGDPFPLCRDTTQLSFIAYPASGHLEVADGYPCQVGYEQVV